jgi:hypothetical protein
MFAKRLILPALLFGAPAIAQIAASTPAPAVTPAPIVVQGQAAPVPVQTAALAPAKAKTICRSSMDTGSLVNHTRRCYSPADWARLMEGHRDEARNLVAAQAAGMTTN